MKTLLKTLLAGAALIPALSFAAPGDALVGTWHSEGMDRALSGDIVFTADGHATLKPASFVPLEGTWQVNKDQLTLTMPPGTSVMKWSVRHDKLSLTYDNGATQTFVAAGKDATK